MKVLDEEVFIVTRTFYGFEDDSIEGLGRAVKGVKVEVKADNDVLYEKYEDESFLRADKLSNDPVECFINYICYKKKEDLSNNYKKALQKIENKNVHISNITCLLIAILSLIVAICQN